GLEIIIDAASSLFDQRSLQRLAEGVLTQLSSLMAIECAGILVLRESDGEVGLSVLAGSGCYRDYVVDQGRPLEPDMVALIHKAFDSRRHDFSRGRYLLYM